MPDGIPILGFVIVSGVWTSNSAARLIAINLDRDGRIGRNSDFRIRGRFRGSDVESGGAMRTN